jgi:NADPH:quinone reductase-like Zn-dependent oxidoreductase
MPLVLYTASSALQQAANLLQGGLKGKTVLIPGGLSGTGSVGVQLAKHVYGASKVITTTSTNKIPLMSQYVVDGSVDQIIDYKKQDIHKEIPSQSVDFAFDNMGAMTSLIPLVKPSGVFLSVATIPTPKLAKKEFGNLPWWLVLVMDIVNVYYNWKLRGKNINYTFIFGAVRNGDLERVGTWVEEGKLKPVVGKVVDLNDLNAIRDGCEQINKGIGGVGKMVVQIVPED